MQIRDRVTQLRRVKAADLRPNPRNWRTHPVAQRDALRGLLAEIGIAGALLARELADGSLELIDGHLRAETLADNEVPVLVLDVDEREAATLLALFDPLASMAQTQAEALHALLGTIETENDALRAVLEQLTNRELTAVKQSLPVEASSAVEAYQVLVDCRDENEQRLVFERLSGEGYRCRALTL
jgi:ParB-like chromosome segregation protein Spo0J